MSLDLSKLTPAPWEVAYDGHVRDAFNDAVAECVKDGDAEFIALARAAFDVMMRRKWMAMCDVEAVGGWWVEGARGKPVAMPRCCPDPFTALVEADAWYTQHVESARVV